MERQGSRSCSNTVIKILNLTKFNNLKIHPRKLTLVSSKNVSRITAIYHTAGSAGIARRVKMFHGLGPVEAAISGQIRRKKNYGFTSENQVIIHALNLTKCD